MKQIVIGTILLCSYFLPAQSLKGIVLSEEKNKLEGVAVFNKNSGAHTHTDIEGTFFLENVTAGDEIYISSLGFESFVYKIEPNDFSTPLEIVLKEATISLDQIVITPKVDALNQIVSIDLETSPVKSSQEVLRKVPGLIIGQHAGGGKAEQIFLRGFDIDHGTDINLTVDGLPVNMVSHAHGQGYSDLHFLIPETINKIDFGKGPYFAERGDFTTAGYVAFETLDKLKNSSVSVEYGDFDALRTVGLFQLLDTKNKDAYLATSLNTFNGPFESPQNFNRFNIMGKYNFRYNSRDKVTLTVSHFQSKWDASGQIPQRAVDAGLISRFGAIDDTEGGNTSRTNILVTSKQQLSDKKSLESFAFFSQYQFQLYSNFTFFLEDPVNGDQIKQQEDRNMMGFQTVFKNTKTWLSENDFHYSAGIGLRYDDVNDVGLFRTKNRDEILENLAFGNVDQINSYAFLNTDLTLGKFKINPSLRLDYFKFDYENFLSEAYDNKSETEVFASPKLNFFYSPSANVQLYLKSGIGFHSNDARVVIANNGKEILPAAYGSDLGIAYKITDKLFFNSALWVLFLEQEFVYVGDAGIVEPSGKTLRKGVDVGLRYEPLDWLYLFGDINYTHARSTEDPKGENYIPLAPNITSTGGFSIKNLKDFSGGINYRFIGDRPANEDNSIVADGYFVTDVNVNYTIQNLEFGVIIENVFDTQWNETQFATESRLFNETNPVEEIHFTPGTPFFIRGKVTINF
ncbi:MAG: TonB-dependent receptor [Flavobacteriaceae bacterium]